MNNEQNIAVRDNILIVDDEEKDVEFLRRILQQENYDITIAENGKKALALLNEKKFDLVILDIILPDIDGYDVCKKIKEDKQNNNLPVLFYTNISAVDNKLIGLKMGASDFLTKNSDARELLIRVEMLLDAKKSIDSAIELAYIDDLTEVYNRRYFQYCLKNEFERSCRYKRDFSCAMIDVDKFKRINDTFGHKTGDVVLRKTANTLRRNIRSSDILCRYGGDEFGVLFPETCSDEAYLAAERIRQNLLKQELNEKESSSAITISCGISSYSNSTKKFDDLLEQADKALYAAKQKGRNQTNVFSSN
ncbi:MAG: diguanylate cyclase [Candidatus Omnitrophica bacterium]|nr:diguanylate cyclase [Candidatus Omnitrophota bacterium]